jgi:hypothetical protein
MKRRSTRTKRDPSRASLREIPEIDRGSAGIIGRGRHVEKAYRSFGTVVVERSVLDALGGQDGVTEILRALAKSIPKRRRRRAA